MAKDIRIMLTTPDIEDFRSAFRIWNARNCGPVDALIVSSNEQKTYFEAQGLNLPIFVVCCWLKPNQIVLRSVALSVEDLVWTKLTLVKE